MGDYVAAETVEFHRMLAASYSGRHDKVIEMWFRLPRSWWSLYALDVGRAYLNAGLFAEAEHHLGLARKVQQAYFMNGDTQAQHNLLTWMLAGFYLGRVMEKTGRLAGARDYYEEFAKHFEGTAATLPQLAPARTLLERLRFSGRGKLVFSDDFEGQRPAGGVRGRNAYLPIAYHDAILEIAFRFDRPGQIEVNLGDQGDPVARLLLASDRVVLLGMEPGARRLGNLDRVKMTFAPRIWHQAVVEVHGNKILAQIDDQAIVTGESAALDIEKRGLAFFDGRSIAALGSVRMYEVAAR
jgi:tetratricopeptide (TPR) repeat protein